MKHIIRILLAVWLLPCSAVVLAATITTFSPQGSAPDAGQVHARFDQPMVAFGDPRGESPFTIDCAMPGAGRWVDGHNWVYDFEEGLAAGYVCRFETRAGLVALSGEEVEPAGFELSGGGPSVVHALPWEGDSSIDERQVFLLGLDAPVAASMIEEYAYCEITGVAEKVDVEVVEDAVKSRLLEARGDFMEFYHDALTDYGRRPLGMLGARGRLTGSVDERRAALATLDPSPIVALRCKRDLPPDVDVSLVWDNRIATLTGVGNDSLRRLAYHTRDEFRVSFHCRRVNADADCNPILPMTVGFTAPIARGDAERIVLAPEEGEPIAASISAEDLHEWVNGVGFPGPFPANARFRLELPEGLRDDAGRELANPERFPLEVATDDYAPLIKFPAEFGIVEYSDDAALAVTLRNIEAVVPLQPGAHEPEVDTVTAGSPWYRRWYEQFRERHWPRSAEVNGRMLRVDDPVEARRWLSRLRDSRRETGHYDFQRSTWVVDSRPGDRSLFESGEATAAFALRKPGGARAMEVIGIPFDRPGFYLVEIASPRLGAALLAEPAPYHAQTAALVTNLAAHFKHGRESSLVWVTELDTARPAPGARVGIHDCDGTVLFEGITDHDGLAPVADALPSLSGDCSDYLIVARSGDDMTFTLSSWQDGIESWRFNLPYPSWDAPNLVKAVFDRPLYRSGERVNMKLFARRHVLGGFEFMSGDALPKQALLVHDGSGARHELTLAFDDHGIAEASWEIPSQAHVGGYRLLLDVDDPVRGAVSVEAGAFRVEEFRVPTMSAIIAPVQGDLVRARSARVDIQLNYLSGGAAGNAPVRLRAVTRERTVRMPGYEEFSLANGGVVEGRLVDHESFTPAGAASGVPQSRVVELDANGAAREDFTDLPQGDTPRELLVEMEYADAGGEILTRATRVALWPSAVVVGIRPDDWAASRERLGFKALALDVHGNPLPATPITVDAFKRDAYSHRKRLVGGFYAYESFHEITRLATLCEGETDEFGMLTCETTAPADGNLILRAAARDASGNASYAHRDVWVAGSEDWWFDSADHDRMDVLAEQDHYEPGDTARLQVRMPFRRATALVTVEREGVAEAFVTTLSGSEPVIELPVAAHHAPNVFVSVLAVRGRTGDSRATALLDLDKPAYRLGITEIQVGHAAHRLDVEVTTDRDVYSVGDTAKVSLRVGAADGEPLPAGAEVAVAAVDEGLLELLPNPSWDLLDAMMGRRAMEVRTATAQMQVVGKRHFGKKAVAAGGGGGRHGTRELFDTLLYWNGRVRLDDNGEAGIEVPLNDSLTSFRVVAVASAGAGLFGTGDATIRSTREVMVIPGIPSLVRQGDRIRATATLRNAAADGQPRNLSVRAVVDGARPPPAAQELTLKAGEAREVAWEIVVDDDAKTLLFDIEASVDDEVKDRVSVDARVVPAVPVTVWQATSGRLDGTTRFAAAAPVGAFPGRGGLRVTLSASLAGQLEGVNDYMRVYPYTCLEQRMSRAVVLDDAKLRESLLNELPAHLDGDGLARFWPALGRGDDLLTSYVLALADEAGWRLPAGAAEPMLDALAALLEGSATHHTAWRADLTLRKLAAMDALSRYRPIDPLWLSAIEIEPASWPTSAVIDWIGVLRRSPRLERRDALLDEASGVLRSRMNFQGATFGFVDGRSAASGRLTDSADLDAVRAVLAVLGEDAFAEDIGAMLRGAMARRLRGHWSTTPANAWGVLAARRFAQHYEAESVDGVTRIGFGAGKSESRDWRDAPDGGSVVMPWPSAGIDVELKHQGRGRPWFTAESLAAAPLRQARSSGYSVRRSVTPVAQSHPGRWTRGDVARITLEISAASDMAWVVVDDPLPAGATVLGSGFLSDSELLSAGDQSWPRPAYDERTFEAYRAYYEFVPAGRWSVEYRVRYNTAGSFNLPETRVEAMYAPHVHGVSPNDSVVVE